MPRTGRPPVPIERKRALGNPGKRKLPEPVELLPVVGATPEPTQPFGRAGQLLWDRIWQSGRGWISDDIDIVLVEMTCEQMDERTRLRRLVWDTGDPRHRRALRELERTIRESLSLLGFTPTDRARLGLNEVKRQSKIEELRERQASRAMAPTVPNKDNTR